MPLTLTPGMIKKRKSNGDYEDLTPSVITALDSELSDVSTSPVENRAITAELVSIKQMIGSPYVASTAAEMTDRRHVYVYVGSEPGYINGNWYYYNGSAWTSGGVYNSQGVQIDQQMSVSSTNPVENKAIKNYVDSVAVHGYSIVELEGTEIVLDAQPDTMYICGEIGSLQINSLPDSGVVDILFTSGTTPAVLSYSNTSLKLPSWFSVGASMTIEISVVNGIYGSVQTWE